MKVGDLVRPRESNTHVVKSHPGIGVVLEVRHPKVAHPDYRTPTALLVFFLSGPQQEEWFAKGELEVISEGR